MPGALIVVPPALLVLGGPLTWLLLAVGMPTRWAAAVVGWAALAAFAGAWLLVGREPTEINLPVPTGTLTPGIRIDAGSFAIGTALLAAYGLLLTFQRRRPHAAALASLAAGAAMTGIEASSLLALALATGTCATLLMAAFREEGGRVPGAFWLSATVGSAALLAAAAAVLAGGGTTVYSATPVSALTLLVFVLLAIAAMCFAGLVPWRAATGSAFSRPRAEAAAVANVLLIPLGLFLLLETYLLGGGNWPGSWLHGAVGAIGVLTALGAALRAQAARERRQVLGELPVFAAGLAAAALGVGSPLAIAAAVTATAAAALGLALAVLVPTEGRLGLLAGAIAVAVPPGIFFGALLLTIQASLENGGPSVVLVPMLALVWLLALAGVARATRLRTRGDGSRTGGLVVILASLAAGALLGPFELAIGLPVASAVMKVTTPPLTTTTGEVVTASGGWGALSLGVIGLVAIVAVALLTRPQRFAPAPAMPPPPLLPVPVPTPAGVARRVFGRLHLQPEGWDRVLERFQVAAERSPAWFWAAVALVLAFVVTR